MNQHDWQASGNLGVILVTWIPLEDVCLHSGDEDPTVCVSVCERMVDVGVSDTLSFSLAFIKDRGGGEDEEGGSRAGRGQPTQLRASLARGSLTNF